MGATGAVIGIVMALILFFISSAKSSTCRCNNCKNATPSFSCGCPNSSDGWPREEHGNLAQVLTDQGNDAAHAVAAQRKQVFARLFQDRAE